MTNRLITRNFNRSQKFCQLFVSIKFTSLYCQHNIRQLSVNGDAMVFAIQVVGRRAIYSAEVNSCSKWLCTVATSTLKAQGEHCRHI